MIRFPRLKTFLTVCPLDEKTWGLRGGTDEIWRVKLTDERAIRAFGALLLYLNGQTAADDILRSLEESGVHRGAAAAVLRQLEAASLLEDADAHGLSGAELQQFEQQIRFFSRFTQQGGAKMQAMLRDSHVGLIGDSSLGESVWGRLVRAGFGDLAILSRQPLRARTWITRIAEPRPRVTVLDLDPDDIWPADAPGLPQVLVVCQDAHDPRLLDAVDAWSKRRRIPWLLVRNLELQEGWVGPLFVPGETASYRSLEARLRANMPNYSEHVTFEAQIHATEPTPPIGALEAMGDLLASIAVIELIKFVTEMKVPELLGKFLTVNLWTWETELHEVLRMPALDRHEASRPSVYPWRVDDQEQSAVSSGRS
jgi:bacteriocin biosynthesis cyclodehydratase domain-containing protein